MSDDLFGDERPDEERREEFETLRAELAAVLSAFIEDERVDDEYLSILLLDAAIRARSIAYVVTVEKPSEAGLRLDLDRFARAFGDLLRKSKKDAARVVRELRKAIVAAEGMTEP